MFLCFIPNIFAIENKALYQEKIDNYIYENRLSIWKLSLIQKHLESYSTQKLESKIIIWYFIEQLQKEIEYQKSNGYHISTPDDIKALYYTAYNASRESKIEDFLTLAKNTEINALVIDITETDGLTSFEFSQDAFTNILPKSSYRIDDISKILQHLHENNIYVIGRIVVFKDNYIAQNYPKYSIKWSYDHSKNWSDYKWNSYADAYAQDVWDYHITLASEAYKMWFDEINFDYVRFPTDGYISQTYYPFANEILEEWEKDAKMQVIWAFAEYTTSKLKSLHPDIILSADIFWLATHTDMYQIGQNIETFVPYFDYVAPMIYPSHYAAWYLGYSVPDNAPYEIFYDSIEKAKLRIDTLNTSSSGSLNISYNTIRPWLQAFHCTWCPGATNYDRTKFRKQIDALNDLWLDSWYSWNAAGRYESGWYNAR